jgi:hypothetical protein
MVWKTLGERNPALEITGSSRLKNATLPVGKYSAGEWLGQHRAPQWTWNEQVTAVRTIDGVGLACAPTIDNRKFIDIELQVGDSAAELLAVLAAFDRPTTVKAAMAALRADKKVRLDRVPEVIDGLALERFLVPATS